MNQDKSNKRIKRHNKVRAKIVGSKSRPRLSVFKSNRHIYAQLIDDSQSITIASLSDINIKKGEDQKKNVNIDQAVKVGEKIAAKAMDLKIKNVVFDRGGFKYHGLIKAVAEGARKGGLKF